VPPPPDNEGPLDPDVAAEEDLVKEQMVANYEDPAVAVRVQGLVKSYAGMCKRVGCCHWKRIPPYHAVKGSWFNIEKDKLFCLLGPNGAGKTTTINCLTGIIPTTAGDGMSLHAFSVNSDQLSIHFLHNLLMILETPCYKIPFAPHTSSCFQSFRILLCHATYNFDRELPPFLVFCSKCHETCFEYVAGLVYGESIRSTAGIAKIRKKLGVCPQFNVLWESLSAREHLHVFGSLKGLSGADIGRGTEELLSQVKLVEAANVRAGSYSGGMKRRLSVAIALIGDPKVVYLDEPVSRHFIYDVSL
jgi:ABC-type Na+ transport system ATPase subunit NatA